jgi:hypothetical protein
MTKGQTYGTIGAIMLAGAMFRGHQTSSTPLSEGAKEVHQSVDKPLEGEGPWLASCRYWAIVRNDSQTAPTPSPKLSIKIDATGDKSTSDVSGSTGDNSKTGCEKWGIPVPPVSSSQAPVIQPEIHAIIAAVPDPIHSHLALDFDRTIDSLMQAASDHRYLASNYWLPWRAPTTAATATTDSSKASSDQATENKRQQQPGLIIFKFSPLAGEKNTGQTSYYRVVYVFLVGESPALGMDGNQLRNALQYEADLRTTYHAKLSMVDPSRVTEAVNALVPAIDAPTDAKIAFLFTRLGIFPKKGDDPIGKLEEVLKQNRNLPSDLKDQIEYWEAHKETIRNYVELNNIDSVLAQPALSTDDVKNVKTSIDDLQLIDQDKKTEIGRIKEDLDTLRVDLETVAFIGPSSSGSATSLRQALLCAPF